MKTLAMAVAAFLALKSSAPAETESEIRDRIVGTWKLVSAEELLKDGTIRPMPAFGLHAQGFLMYQPHGYMCAQLVNPDRPKWAHPVHPTPEEKVAAADGSFAYCGRYEIDVTHGLIIHLPEVATDPGIVGSRQIRPYAFEKGRLVLGDVVRDDPAVARWKIVWAKAPQ